MNIASTNKNLNIRKRWDLQMQEALKSGKKYKSAQAMHADILATC